MRGSHYQPHYPLIFHYFSLILNDGDFYELRFCPFDLFPIKVLSHV